MNNKTYILKKDGIYITDSGFIEINEKIKDKELDEYYIVNREDYIDSLISWIAESIRPFDKDLMKEDLKMLMIWEDEYIFTSNSTNSFIGSHSRNYSEICARLIKLNHEVNNGSC